MVGKETRKLNNMIRLHNIKKFKNIYKCLRDCLNKEKETIESELGTANIARDIQQMMKSTEQKPTPSQINQQPQAQPVAPVQQPVIPQASIPIQQMLATQQTAPTQQAIPSQTMFTTKMDDFNSEDEIGHPPRKRRKDSDESYEESQISISKSKKTKQSIPIRMHVASSQPIVQNLSKLKERRSK